MTGEMSRAELTPENYPIHFAIAGALKGTVEPFDQYQGPYVHVPAKGAKLWLVYSNDDSGSYRVFNERTGQASADCFTYRNPESTAQDAVAAARSVLKPIKDYEAKQKRRELMSDLHKALDRLLQARQLLGENQAPHSLGVAIRSVENKIKRAQV